MKFFIGILFFLVSQGNLLYTQDSNNLMTFTDQLENGLVTSILKSSKTAEEYAHCPGKPARWDDCWGFINAGSPNTLREIRNTRQGFIGNASYLCKNGDWIFQNGSGNCRLTRNGDMVYENRNVLVYEYNSSFDEASFRRAMLNLQTLAEIVYDMITPPTAWYGTAVRLSDQYLNPVRMMPFFTRGNVNISALTQMCQDTRIVPIVALDFIRADWNRYPDRYRNLRKLDLDLATPSVSRIHERITLLTANEIRNNLRLDRSYLIIPKFSWNLAAYDMPVI